MNDEEDEVDAREGACSIETAMIVAGIYSRLKGALFGCAGLRTALEIAS